MLFFNKFCRTSILSHSTKIRQSFEAFYDFKHRFLYLITKILKVRSFRFRRLKSIVLLVQNGIGKTNALDAIYHLAFGKSYFNPIAVQNINHNAEFFVVDGHLTKNERPEKIIV